MPDRICIGIDVGGTKIAGGVCLFPEGRVLTRSVMPTEGIRGGRPVLNDVLRMVRELRSAADSLDAIGLGICELVDRSGNIVSENSIYWQNQPVHEELEAIAPAVIEADVRAAALAEALFGAARGLDFFLYVTVGTGISSCLMLDGKPYLGNRGLTGTMGSGPLSIPCEECGEVGRRTLEDIASGPALVARYRAVGGSARTGHEVLAAAASGETSAVNTVRTASEALASQVAMLVNVLDPEAVVIGGGLGLSTGLYQDHFHQSIRQHIWSGLHRNLPILKAAAGTEAGWIGAATRAWQEFF